MSTDSGTSVSDAGGRRRRARPGAAARRRRPAGPACAPAGQRRVGGEVAVGVGLVAERAPARRTRSAGADAAGRPRRASRAAQTPTVSSAPPRSRAPSSAQAATRAIPTDQPGVAPAGRGAGRCAGGERRWTARRCVRVTCYGRCWFPVLTCAHHAQFVRIRHLLVHSASPSSTAKRRPRPETTANAGIVGSMSSTPARRPRSPVPDAGRRRGDPGHLGRPGARAGAVGRAALHPDRRPPAVPHRGRRAGELHRAHVRRVRRATESAPQPTTAETLTRGAAAATARERHHLDAPPGCRPSSTKSRADPAEDARARTWPSMPVQHDLVAVLGDAPQHRPQPQPGGDRARRRRRLPRRRGRAARRTAASRTSHSWPATSSRHQPSPGRGERPVERPTPERPPAAAGAPIDACSRAARSTSAYSARLSSATCASRSPSASPSACCSRSSKSVEEPFFPPHPRTLTAAPAGVNRLWTID